jgi:hypothetical protein
MYIGKVAVTDDEFVTPHQDYARFLVLGESKNEYSKS